MAEEANLGRWEAREVEPVEIASPARARSDHRSPLLANGSGDHREGPDRPDGGGDHRFWLGVLVGLVPLLLIGGGFALFRMLDGDGGAEDGALVSTGAGEGTGTTVTTPSTLPVQTQPPPTSTGPEGEANETAGSVGDDAATPTTSTTPSESVVATGMVTDGAIEVGGILPDDLRTQWVGELADLATVLGYRLDDRTVIAAGANAGPQEANELLVRFPGAIVFRPDSPQSFDGEAQPIFEAVAGVLNRGSADLNIVCYADPSDPEAVLLALERAEHVHEHLRELGVDPGRLTVEARSPVDAPIVAAEGSPIERRADLEFSFQP